MTHETPEELLIAFAAGELGEAESARVRERFASDAAARETVRLYLAIQRTTAMDDSVAPPEATVARAKKIFRDRQVPRPHVGGAIDAAAHILSLNVD